MRQTPQASGCPLQNQAGIGSGRKAFLSAVELNDRYANYRDMLYP